MKKKLTENEAGTIDNQVIRRNSAVTIPKDEEKYGLAVIAIIITSTFLVGLIVLLQL